MLSPSSPPVLGAGLVPRALSGVTIGRRARPVSPSAAGPIAWRLAAADAVVERDILEPRGVVDAVDHRRQALDIGLPAIRRLVVKQDRTGIVLDQLAFDLPHQLLA